eukprot:808234-Rhodomonas_salina.2
MPASPELAILHEWRLTSAVWPALTPERPLPSTSVPFKSTLEPRPMTITPCFPVLMILQPSPSTTPPFDTLTP